MVLPAAGLSALLLACEDPQPVNGHVPLNSLWTAADAQVWDSAATPAEAWYPCHYQGIDTESELTCLDLAVPLDHAKPAGQTVQLRVYRLSSPTQAPRAQLWILQGGPGASGATILPLAAELHSRDPGLELLVPDHRGTGDSTWLGCTASAGGKGGSAEVDAEEVAACAAELAGKYGPDGLAAFSTTQAARDLALAIGAAGSADVPVFVYGVSYGTYWAHRYLQLHPGQAKGVILDSICPPAVCKLLTFDKNFDDVARQILKRCAADSQCAKYMGSNPVAKAEATLAKLSNGHCPQLQKLGLDRQGLRRVLASFTADQHVRGFLPAVIHRIDRCEAKDIQALSHLLEMMGEVEALPLDKEFSAVLHHNVGYSELYAPSPMPTEQQVAAWREQAIASPDATANSFGLQALWPKYAVGQDSSQWAGNQTPVLMLQGGLDPQTPLAWGQDLAAHLTGSAQRLKIIQDSAHGVLFGSPWNQGEGDCALELMNQFLASPTADPKHLCQDLLDPLDFAPHPQFVLALLGTQSLWLPQEHQPAAMAAARKSRPAGLDRWQRWLRDHPRQR